jgi:hypothetical protein
LALACAGTRSRGAQLRVTMGPHGNYRKNLDSQLAKEDRLHYSQVGVGPGVTSCFHLALMPPPLACWQ